MPGKISEGTCPFKGMSLCFSCVYLPERTKMGYTKRPLEKLNVLDDFLMTAVASDEEVGPEFCRMMLSTFLEREIGEVPDMEYEDGLEFIYLNSEGTRGGSKEIREMLRYFQNSLEQNATNDTLKKIHGYVSKVKVLPEVEKSYMKFEEIIYYERKEAAEEAEHERRVQDICELLEDYGEVPKDVKRKIELEENPEILKKWHKLAARAGSMEAFIKNM